jgi:hypothetical protein
VTVPPERLFEDQQRRRQSDVAVSATPPPARPRRAARSSPTRSSPSRRDPRPDHHRVPHGCAGPAPGPGRLAVWNGCCGRPGRVRDLTSPPWDHGRLPPDAHPPRVQDEPRAPGDLRRPRLGGDRGPRDLMGRRPPQAHAFSTRRATAQPAMSATEDQGQFKGFFVTPTSAGSSSTPARLEEALRTGSAQGSGRPSSTDLPLWRSRVAAFFSAGRSAEGDAGSAALGGAVRILVLLHDLLGSTPATCSQAD